MGAHFPPRGGYLHQCALKASECVEDHQGVFHGGSPRRGVHQQILCRPETLPLNDAEDLPAEIPVEDIELLDIPEIRPFDDMTVNRMPGLCAELLHRPGIALILFLQLQHFARQIKVHGIRKALPEDMEHRAVACVVCRDWIRASDRREKYLACHMKSFWKFRSNHDKCHIKCITASG